MTIGNISVCVLFDINEYIFSNEYIKIYIYRLRLLPQTLNETLITFAHLKGHSLDACNMLINTNMSIITHIDE